MKSSRRFCDSCLDGLATRTRNPLWLPILAALLFLAVSCLTGCAHGRRVVIVNAQDEHAVMRTGDDVRGHVYFYNGDAWERSRNKVNIPEGMFIHFLEE